MNLDKRTEILHDIAARLANINIDAQLESGVMTLDFLKSIEKKTADDLDKIDRQQAFVDKLGDKAYFEALQNIIVEKYDALDTKHLERYLNDLLYEDAVIGVGTQLAPAMEQLNQDYFYGTLRKPTLQ